MITLGNSPMEDAEELEELRRWKDEALVVFRDLKLQEIGKELGLRRGDDIASAVLPWIRMMKSHSGTWAITRQYFDKVYGKK